MRKIQIIATIFSRLCLAQDDDCIPYERFPKVIQTISELAETHASAIATDLEETAIYVGGQILNPALLPEDAIWASGAAQMGRIDLQNNNWRWSKVFA